MKISECIWELLQRRSSVSIPSFGALTATRGRATIHPAQHLFSPPGKIIAFNSEFDTHDEFLVELISHENQITTPEALQCVREFINEIQTALHEKGAYELEGIGKFYFDIERKLRFIPDAAGNFLLSSYGLPQFTSQPVLRPENIPSYAVNKRKPEKKKRRFIWFRF